MTFPTEAAARKFLAQMIPHAEPNAAVIPTTHEHWCITSAREAKQPAKLCCICRQPFHEFACNAMPVASGGCCAYCDDHVVTPARIERAREVGE